MSFLFRRFAPIMLFAAFAGCSSIKDAGNSVSGWVNGGESVDSSTVKKAAGEASGKLHKFGATLRVSKYLDQRKVGNPRLLGTAEIPVRGVDGSQLLLDEEIANYVTDAIRKRFDTEGYQVLEGSGASNAMFEVSGIIKSLTMNVKNRDEIIIEIETTLTEVATGKVEWSGLVVEKNDRFAGVSGNNRNDVIAYLNRELRVASNKTVEAVSASLMAARPELFNLTAGTKPISGVTVYVAPASARNVQETPVASGTQAPPPAYVPRASATAGLLLLNTNPPRAKVYLDEVYFGLSPLRLEIEPGIHSISVKLEGYKMVTEKVSVRKGDNTEMDLKLEK